MKLIEIFFNVVDCFQETKVSNLNTDSGNVVALKHFGCIFFFLKDNHIYFRNENIPYLSSFVGSVYEYQGFNCLRCQTPTWHNLKLNYAACFVQSQLITISVAKLPNKSV